MVGVDFQRKLCYNIQRKVDYCNDNHIPLIIIPYWDRDKITLEYIKEKYYDSKEIYGYSET